MFGDELVANLDKQLLDVGNRAFPYTFKVTLTSSKNVNALVLYGDIARVIVGCVLPDKGAQKV